MNSSGSHYKRKRRRYDNHVDDWLMTYADMITLLLCFFAIFLSISVPKEERLKQAQEEVLERFAPTEHIASQVLVQRNVTGNPQKDVPYDHLPSIVDQFSQQDGMKNADYIEEPKPEPEGDRIKIIEMPSAAFFASGSATLSEEGKALLRQITAETLNATDVQDHIITVEGHTDDVPINTLQFPSNWELSTARAAAVIRFLIENDVSPQRLRASGYADSSPKAPNRDAAGVAIPDNQAQNRRVILKLEKIEKSVQ